MSNQIEQPSNKFILMLFLFLLGVLLFSVTAWILRVPGYMDAEYYYMGGINLASGNGFWEMVLWNYLDDPIGLPHPSHSYWMPLPSILAAIGLALFKTNKFWAAQIPFVMLAACVPLITYAIATRLYNNPRLAFNSALLAYFPGFFLVYMSTTSTITPYMVLGGLFFLALISITKQIEITRKTFSSYFLLGILSGLMHLTRADGILWLFGAFIFSVVTIFQNLKQSNPLTGTGKHVRYLLLTILPISLGYLVPMGPWFLHNIQHIGRPIASGGFHTVWLTDYNQTFIFPASKLNFYHWLKADTLDQIVIRLKAIFANLTTLAAVEGELVLLPLFFAGLVKFWKDKALKHIVFIWLLTFGLMSIVFPYAGERGGFLHASAAFQPFIWAIVPAGFDKFIKWGVQHRDWKAERSGRVFNLFLFLILGFYSLFAFYSKVIGEDLAAPIWRSGWENYAQIERRIELDFPDKSQVILVNNPPGYFLASGGRPAVVLPDGDVQVLMEVADKYQVSIVAVDRNIVAGLNCLYFEPKSNQWLEYLYVIGETHVYRVK